MPVKLASLIHDLSKEIKLEDLARRLPYEEAQLQQNLELLKLPEDYGVMIEKQAKDEAEELPTVMSFVFFKAQLAVIEKALKIAQERLPKGAKNLKALSIEQICADFLANQEVNSETQ